MKWLSIRVLFLSLPLFDPNCHLQQGSSDVTIEFPRRKGFFFTNCRYYSYIGVTIIGKDSEALFRLVKVKDDDEIEARGI